MRPRLILALTPAAALLLAALATPVFAADSGDDSKSAPTATETEYSSAARAAPRHFERERDHDHDPDHDRDPDHDHDPNRDHDRDPARRLITRHLPPSGGFTALNPELRLVKGREQSGARVRLAPDCSPARLLVPARDLVAPRDDVHDVPQHDRAAVGQLFVLVDRVAALEEGVHEPP